MLEQLKYLVELQVLEDKKSQLLRDGGDTPRRMLEIQHEFERLEGEYLSKKADCEHNRKLHRLLEQNVSDLEARIARSKNRMSDVKTNKEYQAMLKEIEETKKEIAGKEEGMLDAMEKIETLTKELEVLGNEVEGQRKLLEEDKKKLQVENERLKEKVDHLDALQQKVRDRMDPALLKRTEYLLLKQSGIAVAAVQNGTCQICHLNIPPQKFIELQRDDMIHQCPHCHRFLYWPGHEGYNVLEEDFDGL